MVPALVFVAALSAASMAHAQAGVLTVGALIQGLQELAKQVENSAQTVLQQGNTALAQQQMIAAGSMRSLATQLSETYKDRLNDTASKISFAQGNLEQDASKVLEQVKGIEKGTSDDVRDRVYQLQGSVNQLLNRLPIPGKVPVFYGMLTYDIGTAFPNKGFDIELLGFNLSDSKMDFKPPKIVIGGEVIPADKVSVQEDRVRVTLPEAVKQKIGFRQDACGPPSPFSVAMTVYYRGPNRYWFFKGNDLETTMNSFALAEPDFTTAKIVYLGTTSTTVNKTETFSQPGSYASVGCTDNGSGSAVTTLPANASEITCNAQWINTRSLKNQTASCAIGGSTVTASGTIRGLDRTCIYRDVLTAGLFGLIGNRDLFCDCPGGGHGTLTVTGSYKAPFTEIKNFKDESAVANRFLENFEASIPSDSARTVKQMNIVLRRPGCEKTLDSLDLNVPAEPTAIASQDGVNGLFNASYRNQRLTISRKQK